MPAKIKVRFKAPKNMTLVGNQFIVNAGTTMGNLLWTAKSRIRDFNPDEALFMFVGGKVMPALHEPVSFYYDKYQKDCILEIELQKENCFGGNFLPKSETPIVKLRGFTPLQRMRVIESMDVELFESPTDKQIKRELKKINRNIENGLGKEIHIRHD